MAIIVLVLTFVVYTTVVAGQHLGVTDAVAARIDAQAWRVDRLTKQFQTISDLADGARAAAKDGGDTARHLMNQYLKGMQASKQTAMFFLNCSFEYSTGHQ